MILLIRCCISASVARPSGFTAFKETNTMSVFLSYSPSEKLVSSLYALGSLLITPSGVSIKPSVDRISSLIITPVSLRPALSSIFLASCANLLTLPSSTDCAKLIIFGATSFGGKYFSWRTFSASINWSIVSWGNTPSLTSLSPNSSGVSLNPSAFLATSNS